MNPTQILDQILAPTVAVRDTKALSCLKPRGAPALPKGEQTNTFRFIRTLAATVADRVDKNANRIDRRRDDGELALILIQAAIAAARSDRRLDDAALNDIAKDLADQGLSRAAENLLRSELLRPPMLDHLTRKLRTRTETIEVYVASRLATDPRDELSDHYLKMLAARLGLEHSMTNQIEVTIAASR